LFLVQCRPREWAQSRENLGRNKKQQEAIGAFLIGRKEIRENEKNGLFPFDQKFLDFRCATVWNGKNSGKSFRKFRNTFSVHPGRFPFNKNYRLKSPLVEWNGYDPEFEVTCSATQGMMGETFRGFRAA